MAGRLIHGIRIRPLSEEAQGFGAGFSRQLLIGGDRHHAGGVRFAAETEGAMRQATEHEDRPLARSEVVDQRGDGGTTSLETEVMDGANGFVGDDGRLVLHEARSGSVVAATQGDNGREADGSAIILGDGVEGFGGLAEVIDGEGTSVAKHRVGVGVFLEHREDLREIFVGAETGGRDGGEGPHAERRVENQLTKRQVVALERGFFESAHSLGADFGVGVSQQRHEALGGGGAVGERSDGRVLATEGFAGGDGGAATGEDAEAPDAVQALETVRRLRGGFETVRGVRTTGQLDLRAKADALVAMGEQFGKFGGGLLREAALDEVGHGRSDFGLHHLVGFKGHKAAGVMGLPAGDEVGDDEATLPVVFDVGRGHAPEKLVRFGHLHAGARRLHLEGPDARGSGGTAVVADMEVLGFGFQEAGAGVIRQTGRTGRDVSGRGNDEGRLGGVLQLPDLLGHPAGKRTLLEADLAVEGVHCLVLHFPAGVGAFDDVDDAGSVALVGIVIHGEAVAEFVEGDFLGIAQAEVDDLEVRTIGLKTEDRSTVMRVVLLAFLAG